MATAFVDSYDPRVWAARWQPAVAPVAAPLRQRLIAIAAAGAVLLVGAGTAWLTRSTEEEAVVAEASTAPQAAPTPSAREVRRVLVLSRASDLAESLTTAGLPADLVTKVVAAAMPALRSDGEIRAALTLIPDGEALVLDRLEASNSDSSGVVIRRLASGELEVSRVEAQISTRILVRRGTMDGDSFYSSAVAVGIPNSLIPVFAKALAFDFNFQTEVSAGDAFEAAYAQPVNASGEDAGVPRLLYASLTTAAKSATVYRVPAEGGAEDEWFDSSGRSIVRSLMRTPVDGARVSSKFGMRFHPVLHFAKLHGGIDFAAPTGTPIYAAGTGTIEFAGPKGANGNFVALHHDNGWRTLYLHMNRFGDGIASGVRVTQGQQIGEVGTTGRSTGPHLHYEVHIDGVKVDPLSVPTDASGKTLQGAALIAFEKIRDQIDVSRAGQGG
ncbi:M23 family metallopeptidase [Sphingomonas radiodurans]|uniref:M23 family metallopeptidase n=1 Tax=Sphingomonas radiodurans TaxID=2890321 RepID=UPI001E409D89|nr:M23 family metallopeptidase [Sphingomonas radiodurans]WBH16681.1 M23 family metallopeptidase [Sphingomonas radiodurans]